MRAGVFAARALTHGATGRIVSASPRAANLLLDGGAVIGLLPSETPLHPWAIAGAVDPSTLRIGDAARVEGRLLIIGRARVDLTHLRVVDLSLTTRPLSVGAQHAAPLHTDVAELVGLGPGLTPSGDNVIVGRLAALDLARDADPTADARRRALVAALPHPLTAHTSRLSAQMVEAAIEGQYPEPLVHLAATLSRDDPDPSDLEAAIHRVAALGHDSGRDLLAGFRGAGIPAG